MRIFVGNISWSVQEGQLRKLFEQFGTVSELTILQDLAMKRSRGFGFVEMLNDEQGLKAIITLDGTEIDGRKLAVSKARPRPDESRGDRFRRDRYPEK